FYRGNRDTLLGALERAFDGGRGAVRWNRPDGGFFLGVTLPFAFGQRETVECAREHGVIVMPMSFFSLDGTRRDEVRLAFSNAGPEAIEDGVRRFAAYVGAKRGAAA
ncbi:GntR family transcriptional regulator, partial [Burkholderia glumae]